MTRRNILIDPKYNQKNKNKKYWHFQIVLRYDTSIRLTVLKLAILAPIEFIIFCLVLSTLIIRPAAWIRCLQILTKHRILGDTNLKQHFELYFAMGYNLMFCFIDIFVFPVFVIASVTVVRTYHTFKAVAG